MAAGALLFFLGPLQGAAQADNELASLASTFYIVAPGEDNSIAPVVHSLADQLQSLFDRANGPGKIWVIPRLAWSPDDLQSQCENDPGKDKPNGPRVLGGMILEGTNTYNATDGYVLWSHAWAEVSTNAEIVSCAPVGFPKPTITWVSNDLKGYGSRNGFRFETTTGLVLLFTLQNTDAKYLALDAALGAGEGASTFPAVNDAKAARDAAMRVTHDLVEKLNASCASADPNIRALCSRLGLPYAAGTH